MITIDKSRCNLCGICVSTCVRKILHLGKKSVEVTDELMCIGCGHCKAVCPTDAPRFSTGNEQFEPVPTKEEIPAPAPFLRFLRRRRSLRKYLPRTVEKEKLDWIIQAGRYAPTGGNRQNFEFTVVSGRKIIDEVCTLATGALQAKGKLIRELVERHQILKEPIPEEVVAQQVYPAVWDRIAKAWEEEGADQLLHGAPGLILVHTKVGVSPTPESDAALAADHMVLMAETLGLGTCHNGFLIWALGASVQLQKLLQIPVNHEVYMAFTVGYPDVTYLRLTARKPAKVTWLGEHSPDW